MRASLAALALLSVSSTALAQDAVPDPVTPEIINSGPTTVFPKPVPQVAVPRDWRGVFDAIDAGQWASAKAGIASLPPSILAPLAKALPTWR